MVNVDFIWPPSEVILTPTPMAVVTQLMVWVFYVALPVDRSDTIDGICILSSTSCR